MNEESFKPKNSYWPIMLAISVLLIAVGIVSFIAVSLFGLFLLFTAIIGWAWENRSDGQEESNG